MFYQCMNYINICSHAPCHLVNTAPRDHRVSCGCMAQLVTGSALPFNCCINLSNMFRYIVYVLILGWGKCNCIFYFCISIQLPHVIMACWLKRVENDLFDQWWQEVVAAVAAEVIFLSMWWHSMCSLLEISKLIRGNETDYCWISFFKSSFHLWGVGSDHLCTDASFIRSPASTP